MSIETSDPAAVQTANRRLVAVGGAGLVAGIAFGVLIQFGLQRMGAIGAMYTLGEPSLTVGWVAHLFHSALFGAIFGLLLDGTGLDEQVAYPPAGILLGVGFGALLWAINIVVLWPVWLNGVGLSGAPSIPFLPALRPLLGHLLWGGILGGLTAVLYR